MNPSPTSSLTPPFLFVRVFLLKRGMFATGGRYTSIDTRLSLGGGFLPFLCSLGDLSDLGLGVYVEHLNTWVARNNNEFLHHYEQQANMRGRLCWFIGEIAGSQSTRHPHHLSLASQSCHLSS